MTRDIHQAPSRLASSRPESTWKTHSTRPSDQNTLPVRGSTLRDPSDYDLEHDIADGVPGVSPIYDSYSRAYEPLVVDDATEVLPARDDRPPLSDQSIYEIEADEAPYRPVTTVRSDRSDNGHARARNGWRGAHQPPVEPDYAPPALTPSAPPRVAVEPELAPAYDFAGERGELSPSDQYQLLLYNIQLYDDDWKLTRIRGTAQDKWMRAYLLPRYRKIEWEEAAESGQLLMIAIDNCGNTVVREPKKPGFFRRLLNWLYGR